MLENNSRAPMLSTKSGFHQILLEVLLKVDSNVLLDRYDLHFVTYKAIKRRRLFQMHHLYILYIQLNFSTCYLYNEISNNHCLIPTAAPSWARLQISRTRSVPAYSSFNNDETLSTRLSWPRPSKELMSKSSSPGSRV